MGVGGLVGVVLIGGFGVMLGGVVLGGLVGNVLMCWFCFDFGVDLKRNGFEVKFWVCFFMFVCGFGCVVIFLV